MRVAPAWQVPTAPQGGMVRRRARPDPRPVRCASCPRVRLLVG
jgi:hypothetical protein